MAPVSRKSYFGNTVPSSPYSLFGIPVSNSPPTPVDKRSQKAAARRRRQRKLAQIVIAPQYEKTSEKLPIENEATKHPLTTECRVVLTRLELISVGSETHVSSSKENSDPNIGKKSLSNFQHDSPGGSGRQSLNATLTDSMCRSNVIKHMDKTASPNPSSPFTLTNRSELNTAPLSSTRYEVAEVDSSTSSDESEENRAGIISVRSTSRDESSTKHLGRRKLSRPCGETSHHHHHSKSLFAESGSSMALETTSSRTLLNSSKLSALHKRRTLTSANTTGLVENSTPQNRRRRSETQFSEFYMSQLRSAGQLQVVAERISWLKLAPLIMPEYPVDFQYIFKNWGMKIVSKLGEGSFSEVYRVRTNHCPEDEFEVFKVIPAGQPGQPTFDDMLPEMSMCLAGRCLLESPRNRAPSFLSLRGTHLVQGPLTKEMIACYEAFQQESPEETEQPHPSERPAKQFYIAFYTSYDGCELEKELPKLSGDMKTSIVMQITYALAAAELSFEFEHRDLHLSNIVIKECEDAELEFRIGGKSFEIRSFGKRAALIDYGMCRLVVDEVLHSPFEPEILVGPGLQRWTYREQHRMLDGNYHQRCLQTNGLWIFYLLRKLFRRRPVSSKLFYGAQINRLFEELSENELSARECVELLENCELNESQSLLL